MLTDQNSTDQISAVTTRSAVAESVSESSAPRRKHRGGGARIVGIDLARFLALIGMMAAHVWTVNVDGSPSAIDSLVSGKAAALFALLAGVGIVLTSRSALADGRVWAARRNLFGRGLALVLIGLTLGLAPGSVVVILVYYGVMFWVAIPMLRWTNTALLTVAGILAAGWPVVSAWLRQDMEQSFELGSANWLSLLDPASFVRGLFLTGSFPVATWIVYAMVGMVVGRLILAARDDQLLRRLGGRLVLVGGALAAAAWAVVALAVGGLGAIDALVEASPIERSLIEKVFYGAALGAAPTGSPWWLVSPAPHSGTLIDLMITTGVALAVLGLCLVLGTVLRGRAALLLEPVRRAGAAPLTVYAVHVLAASVPAVLLGLGVIAVPESMPWYLSSGALWGLHIGGALVTGLLLAALNRRGPLETFVSWSGRALSRRHRSAA